MNSTLYQLLSASDPIEECAAVVGSVLMLAPIGLLWNDIEIRFRALNLSRPLKTCVTVIGMVLCMLVVRVGWSAVVYDVCAFMNNVEQCKRINTVFLMIEVVAGMTVAAMLKFDSSQPVPLAVTTSAGAAQVVAPPMAVVAPLVVAPPLTSTQPRRPRRPPPPV